MLTRVDRDTIAKILGPDWDLPEAPGESGAEAEKTEGNIDTPARKPEQ